jgi:hypothetical protein
MILDDLKTILNGAVGSLTFGIYHMYLTTNIINENKRTTQLKFDENNRTTQLKFDENNRTTQLRFDELFDKIERCK